MASRDLWNCKVCCITEYNTEPDPDCPKHGAKKAFAKVTREGQTWIVRIDDDVKLQRVLVVKQLKKCTEVQEVIDGSAKGPKRIYHNRDIEFVEQS